MSTQLFTTCQNQNFILMVFSPLENKKLGVAGFSYYM